MLLLVAFVSGEGERMVCAKIGLGEEKTGAERRGRDSGGLFVVVPRYIAERRRTE